jgi:glycosyltransferase involved in cell wall biosynthesis
LLIVGDGPCLGNLMRHWQVRAVPVGSRRHDDMPWFYNAMDVFINPTARHQGFDLTTLEAMLCGTPVLVSDINTAREVLTAGATFFELGNVEDLVRRVRALAGSPEEARRMGGQARRLANRLFTKERMLDQVEAIFYAAATDEKSAYRHRKRLRGAC